MPSNACEVAYFARGPIPLTEDFEKRSCIRILLSLRPLKQMASDVLIRRGEKDDGTLHVLPPCCKIVSSKRPFVIHKKMLSWEWQP